jgi:hypothetical protein
MAVQLEDAVKNKLLLGFAKAFGNETRLKIWNMLSEREYTNKELAATLGVEESTISEHLGILKSQELITTRAEGKFRYAKANPERLGQIMSMLFTTKQTTDLFADVENEEDRRIMETFFEDGRFQAMPAQFARYERILRWFVRLFEVGKRYPEKEVNAIIKQYYDDFATTRRDLVDLKYMTRENGIYWRLETDPIDPYAQSKKPPKGGE